MDVKTKPWQKVIGGEFIVPDGVRCFVFQQGNKAVIVGTDTKNSDWIVDHDRRVAEKKQRLSDRREKRKDNLKNAKASVKKTLTDRYDKNLKTIKEKKLDRATNRKARLIAKKLAHERELAKLEKEIKK